MSLDNTNPNLFCVYMHTNKVNNKRYIGITNQRPSYRWRLDGSGYKHQIFGRAINKYGWENFDHELLAIDVSKEEACELEQKYIQEYQTTNPTHGYNVSTGGEAGAAGVYNRGCSRPVYQYDVDGNYIREWPSVDEAERQLGVYPANVWKCTVGKYYTTGGFQWSREKVDKLDPIDLSEIQRLKHNKELTIYKYSMVDGTFIEKFDSIWDAAESVKDCGIDLQSIRAHITMCLKDKQFSCYEYRWFKEYQGESVSIKRYLGNRKMVFQYSLQGEYITSFESAMEAARVVNGSCMKIGACCRGVRKSSAGYMQSFDFKGNNIAPYPKSVNTAVKKNSPNRK